jgi:hypothetical protein
VNADGRKEMNRQTLRADATGACGDSSETLLSARTQNDLAARANVLEDIEKQLKQADRALLRVSGLLTQLGSFVVSHLVDAALAWSLLAGSQSIKPKHFRPLSESFRA